MVMVVVVAVVIMTVAVAGIVGMAVGMAMGVAMTVVVRVAAFAVAVPVMPQDEEVEQVDCDSHQCQQEHDCSSPLQDSDVGHRIASNRLTLRFGACACHVGGQEGVTFAVDLHWVQDAVHCLPDEDAGDQPGAEDRDKGPQNLNAVVSAGQE